MGLAAGTEWLGSLTVLARIGAALAVAPPFAQLAIPRRVRALIAVAVTIGLTPGLNAPIIATPGALAVAIAGEVLIGLAMGLAISLVFSAAGWAGDVISQQLGLSLSEAYDPAGGSEGTPLGRAYWML